jgi:hypothetical protein
MTESYRIQNGSDGLREAPPLEALLRQRFFSCRCQVVHAAATPADLGPRAFEELLRFQPVKRGIKGPLRKVQGPTARLRETAGDVVAVRGAGANHSQQKEIQVPFQSFFLHTEGYYASVYEVCKEKVHSFLNRQVSD